MDNVTRAEALTALMSGGDICAMVISREEVSSEADISLSRRRSTSTFTRRKPSKSSKVRKQCSHDLVVVHIVH